MRPGLALKTPHAGIKNVRVGEIDIEVGDAVLVIDVECLGPRLAAVSRHVHAALFVWTKRVAQCADVHDVGILRMDGDSRDALGFSQTHVLPRLAAIGRLVNSIAERNAVAHVRLASTDPDHLRITDRKSTRLNSSHGYISYAVFCLKKKKKHTQK